MRKQILLTASVTALSAIGLAYGFSQVAQQTDRSKTLLAFSTGESDTISVNRSETLKMAPGLASIETEGVSTDLSIRFTESDDIKLAVVGEATKSVLPEKLLVHSGERLVVSLDQSQGFSSVVVNLKADLEIPKKFKGELTVSLVSGDIRVERGELKALTAKTVSGDVRLSDVSLQTLKTKTISGSLDLQARAVSISTDSISGDANVLLAKVTQDFNFSTVSGEVEFLGADPKKDAISVKSVSGEIRLPEPLKVDESWGSRKVSIEARGGSTRISGKSISGDIVWKQP